MSINFENLPAGEYRLTVCIEALSDTSFSLFGNHRHFLYHSQKMTKGETMRSEFAVAIRNADFQKQDNYRDESYEIFWDGDVKLEAAIEPKSYPVLYTLGDSTVCNQTHIGTSPIHRCGGWGQALPKFLKTAYAVSNHAEQGTHTKNCLDCHLLPVLEQVKKGDLVLCQFGHNDQKQAWLDADGGYFENLIKIGNLIQEKDAEFIICTPINRLIYIDNKINTYLDPWRDAAKKAAKALGTKCIDLHSFTTDLYAKMGDEAENLFYHSPDLDRTHPNDFGALSIAEYVCEQIKGGKQ
ncbi:MAG: hypothetical protein IJ297_01410 [Clostridia bacterium]|nr:hypothetical protein [Clostridia bacterium]